MQRKIISIILYVFIFTAGISGQELPDWFTPLRDAVYNQVLSSTEVSRLYDTARERATRELSGTPLLIMLSRCEYMMGRSFLLDNKENEAAPCFERGMAYAQEVLDQKETSEAWEMLAENLSYYCTLKSWGFVLINGPKVERHSNKAVDIDAGNTAALFLIAARYIYAPAPFHNYRKGQRILEDILQNYNHRLQKDVRFNVYTGMGYLCIERKNNEEAKSWYSKALELYPDNIEFKTLYSDLIQHGDSTKRFRFKKR